MVRLFSFAKCADNRHELGFQRELCKGWGHAAETKRVHVNMIQLLIFNVRCEFLMIIVEDIGSHENCLNKKRLNLSKFKLSF